jgi:hypothetical protein
MSCRIQFSILAFADVAWKKQTHTNDTGKGSKNETMLCEVAQVCSGLKVRRIDSTFQCKPNGHKNKGHNSGRCIQQLLVEFCATLENGECQLKGQRR